MVFIVDTNKNKFKNSNIVDVQHHLQSQVVVGDSVITIDYSKTTVVPDSKELDLKYDSSFESSAESELSLDNSISDYDDDDDSEEMQENLSNKTEKKRKMLTVKKSKTCVKKRCKTSSF